jgi:hypothetical protein
MLRRLRTYLLGPPRPKYRPTHSMHRTTPTILEEPVRYSHGPADVRLPRHQTIPIPPLCYADQCPTQTLPKIPAEVPAFTMGRDLLTGAPRAFGLAALAALDNISDALRIRSVTYFA